MKLYGYDDVCSQSLHVTPFLRPRLQLFTSSHLESQPIFTNLFFPPIDACVIITCFDDATRSILLGLDTEKVLQIRQDAQIDLQIQQDSMHLLRVNLDGSVTLKLNSPIGADAETMLLIGNDATKAIKVSADGDVVLNIENDASKTLADDQTANVILQTGPDASKTLEIEEPCT